MAANPVSSVAGATPVQSANWTPVLYTSNGVQQAEILPGTNIPPGYQAVDYDTWKKVAQSYGVNGTGQTYVAGQTIGMDLGTATDNAYTRYASDPTMGAVIAQWEQGNQATPSGEVQVKDSQGNLVWTTQQDQQQDAALQASNSTATQVAPGQYAPAGSAATTNPLGVSNAAAQNAVGPNGIPANQPTAQSGPQAAPTTQAPPVGNMNTDPAVIAARQALNANPNNPQAISNYNAAVAKYQPNAPVSSGNQSSPSTYTSSTGATVTMPQRSNYTSDADYNAAVSLTQRSAESLQQNIKNAAANTPSNTMTAQQLANYVLRNGTTNLASLSWWSTNPNKQAAWSIIQQVQSGEAPSGSIAQASTPEQADQALNSVQQNMYDNTTSSTQSPPTTSTGPEGTVTASTPPQDVLTSEANGPQGTVTPSGAISGSGGGAGINASVNTPQGGPPTPYDVTAATTSLRSQYGVDAMQANLNTLNAQKLQAQTDLQAQTQSEQDKPGITEGLMEGRISTETQLANEKINQIDDQITAQTAQLQTATDIVNQMVTAGQQTYENAYNSYNTQYSQALSTANEILSAQGQQFTQDQQTKTSALANFTTIANQISSGALDPTKLTPTQLATWSSIEAQAGLPAGTLQQLATKARNDWSIVSAVPFTNSQTGQVGSVLVKFNKVTNESQMQTILSPVGTTSGAAQTQATAQDAKTDQAIANYVGKPNSLGQLPTWQEVSAYVSQMNPGYPQSFYDGFAQQEVNTRDGTTTSS